ncbi:MAG: hypothetical protein JNK37_16795 [Verrucomicrobiales bacterium]|nr:hypothetical protein [Verrucomicrobiales bacterium]
MSEDLTPEATKAILQICLLAAFADGGKCEAERERFRAISGSLGDGSIDLAALYRDTLLSKPDLATLAAVIEPNGARQLAYEMAVAVCESDDELGGDERVFLADLRRALGLGEGATLAPHGPVAAVMALEPPPLDLPASPAPADDTDAMVLRYAILAGALELLPQTMATLAIVPIQTKMVYRIGRRFGHELDRKSVAEFMAAIGIGLASQVVEGFARQFAKGLAKSVFGKKGGKIGDSAAGVAMSFATTYALGQLAQAYFAGGRNLSTEALKSRFSGLLERGKTLAVEHQPQIAEQFSKLRNADLGTLLKAGA